MKRFVLSIVISFLFLGSVHGTELYSSNMGISTGQTFMNICGKYPQNDYVFDVSCELMVREVAGTYWLTYYLERDEQPYCMSEYHSVMQYVYIVRNFLEDNPVYISKPSVSSFSEALRRAFSPPCN